MFFSTTRTAATLIATALLSACSTIGQDYRAAPPPPEGQALVYVMRSRMTARFMWPTSFQMDGKHIASLHDKGYSWVHVPAGPHVLRAGLAVDAAFNDWLSVTINTRPGQVYYVEYAQFIEPGVGGKEVLRVLPEDLGQVTVPLYKFKPAE